MKLKENEHVCTYPVFDAESGKYMIKSEFSSYDPFTKKTSVKTELKLPEDCGYKRSFVVNLLMIKDIRNDDELEGTEKAFFVSECTISLKPDMGQNLWLTQGDDLKIYICGLDELGFRMAVGLESNDNCTVTRGKPKRISLEEFKTLMKESGYVFGKVGSSGELYTTV